MNSPPIAAKSLEFPVELFQHDARPGFSPCHVPRQVQAGITLTKEQRHECAKISRCRSAGQSGLAKG